MHSDLRGFVVSLSWACRRAQPNGFDRGCRHIVPRETDCKPQASMTRKPRRSLERFYSRACP